MFAFLSLAISMLMISDRDQFWNTHNIAVKTQYANVDEQGSVDLLNDKEINEVFQKMSGKRLMFLVHGFNDTQPASSYSQILNDIQNWDTSCHYDQVIGYVWPCYDSLWDYYAAEKNIDFVMPRLRNILVHLQSSGSNVDVIAHSLGNRLVLEVLNFEKEISESLINNFFSVAPAVNDDSIDKNNAFALSTLNCTNMFVFYSQRDAVLKWLYPLVEWDEALGYEGDENPAKLPSNVQIIDCSSLIDSHVAYLYCKPVFFYVGQVESHEFPGPSIAQDVAIHADGEFEVTRWRSLFSHFNK